MVLCLILGIIRFLFYFYLISLFWFSTFFWCVLISSQLSDYLSIEWTFDWLVAINVSSLYKCTWWSKRKKKKSPTYGVMEIRSNSRDHNCFLCQAINVSISAAKLGVWIWRPMDICSVLEPAPSSQSRNYNLGYYWVYFRWAVEDAH